MLSNFNRRVHLIWKDAGFTNGRSDKVFAVIPATQQEKDCIFLYDALETISSFFGNSTLIPFDTDHFIRYLVIAGLKTEWEKFQSGIDWERLDRLVQDPNWSPNFHKMRSTDFRTCSVAEKFELCKSFADYWSLSKDTKKKFSFRDNPRGVFGTYEGKKCLKLYDSKTDMMGILFCVECNYGCGRDVGVKDYGWYCGICKEDDDDSSCGYRSD
jgi:hypothetical protein